MAKEGVTPPEVRDQYRVRNELSHALGKRLVWAINEQMRTRRPDRIYVSPNARMAIRAYHMNGEYQERHTRSGGSTTFQGVPLYTAHQETDFYICWELE